MQTDKKIEKNKFIVSTTSSLDGYRINEYLGVETAEIVLTAGAKTEMFGAIAKIIGVRSTHMETKLDKARNEAFQVLREKAERLGANALIGLSLVLTAFEKNSMGIIVTATLVSVTRNTLNEIPNKIEAPVTKDNQQSHRPKINKPVETKEKIEQVKPKSEPIVKAEVKDKEAIVPNKEGKKLDFSQPVVPFKKDDKGEIEKNEFLGPAMLKPKKN